MYFHSFLLWLDDCWLYCLSLKVYHQFLVSLLSAPVHFTQLRPRGSHLTLSSVSIILSLIATRIWWKLLFSNKSFSAAKQMFNTCWWYLLLTRSMRIAICSFKRIVSSSWQQGRGDWKGLYFLKVQKHCSQRGFPTLIIIEKSEILKTFVDLARARSSNLCLDDMMWDLCAGGAGVLGPGQ